MNESVMKKYVYKIIEQVKKTSFFNQYETIYLGGGTPNHLSNELLFELLNNLKPYLNSNYEFTIECNPDLITIEQINIFNKTGINRISLGVQSTNNSILKLLKRTHSFQDVENAIKLLQSNNITNISCDFIYDLPNTTNSDLDNAIKFLKEFNIPHVSFYALEIKENSILKRQNYYLDLENQESKMQYLFSQLKANNFIRYEVSNWCIDKKYMSKHNLAYWLSNEWKSLGYGGCGFENMCSYEIGGSIDNFYVTKFEYLEDKDYYFQILMMGLRLVDGLDLNNSKYLKSYEYYKNKLTDCFIENNQLKIKNIDLLHDVLVKLL